MLAATTFWFFSALNKSDYSTKIEYPITFVYPADSTILLGELPENIILDVSGGGWNLLRKTFSIDKSPVVVELDEPTRTPYILGSDLMQDITEKLQGSLRLNYVVTDTIFIDIEKKAQKDVVLSIDSLHIDLEENFRIISPISIMPKTIVMDGPETQVEAAPDTFMIRIAEEEISENYNENVPVSYENPQYINLTPSEVNVSFEIAPFTLLTREVQPTLVNFPKDSSLTVAQEVVSISYWVRNDLLEPQDSLRFTIMADLKKMNKTDSTITPELLSHPPAAKDILLLPTQLKVIHAKPE